MGRMMFRLMFRKMRHNLPQLIGICLLVMVGATFFVTLYTIYLSYDDHANQLFRNQGYADVTYYGSFSEDDVAAVASRKGIRRAQGRVVQDFREGDAMLRAVSLTDGINMPYLYEGVMPTASNECAVISKHARARGIGAGDTLVLDGRSLRVTAIAASPEYVYMVRNERALMAEPDSFGVVYVTKDFFDGKYNEIVALGDIQKDAAEKLGETLGATRTVMQDDQLNKVLFREDLKQIRTFAYIFPLIFALLIIMIVYVMIKRTITLERRQIGIYKALGVTGGRLVFIYVAQTALMAMLGAILGCIAAALLCDTIIGFFSTMFEVPGLAFVFYPVLWGCVILAHMALSVFSVLISVRSVLQPTPAQLMRPRMPSGGKRILLEKATFFWNRLSFNTRYAFKSALRNKGRFLAVLLGMCGSCALLTFALGFFNSVKYTQKAYFDDFANYDILIGIGPIPLEVTHPAEKSLDEVNRALVLPVRIDGEEYPLYVVEESFDMQHIDTQRIKDGVVIPAHFSKKWNAEAGDMLRINDAMVRVAGVFEQNFGLSLYTSYDYAREILPDFKPVYNVIFARGADIGEIRALSREQGFDYSTLEDDKTSFASVMESLSTLVWFMLACAVILGLTVLYSVGLMNLSAREYEYMFMGVMGYSLKSIMVAHIKETVMQLVIALPVGFALGYGILNIVKTAFSGDNFVLSSAIYPESYAYAGVIVIMMSAVIAVISGFHINRLDIVEGLKVINE
ncbi:MAG: ABC transporter permease [Bacillota bacterium]